MTVFPSSKIGVISVATEGCIFIHILMVSWGQCHFKIRTVGFKDPGLFMCIKKNYSDTPHHRKFW
jgi:hypothetical protein